MSSQEIKHCTHYVCRCARAEELAQMADATGDGRYLRQAIEAHSRAVPCRVVGGLLANGAPVASRLL